MSKTDSPSAMGKTTVVNPLASKFIFALKMFITAKVAKLPEPVFVGVVFDNLLTQYAVHGL
jgi:hypothetical protein